jgi:hypothetical protein
MIGSALDVEVVAVADGHRAMVDGCLFINTK